MSILVDWQIKEYAANHRMIEPFNEEQLNAASYDVCVGNKLKMAVIDNQWRDYDLSRGQKFWLKQGDFILTETDNFFNIPRNICAQFALKSSRGREGYGHALAGFIDPSWYNSKLTLELFNHNPNPIPIYKGLKIGQIIFTRTDAQPIKAYDERGRYNNDDGVRESKG